MNKNATEMNGTTEERIKNNKRDNEEQQKREWKRRKESMKNKKRVNEKQEKKE